MQLAEAGVADFVCGAWFGLFAPTGTPRDIVTLLNMRINAATRELTAPLKEIGGYPMHGTPEEFADTVVFLASERASYLTGTAIAVDGGRVKGVFS